MYEHNTGFCISYSVCCYNGVRTFGYKNNNTKRKHKKKILDNGDKKKSKLYAEFLKDEFGYSKLLYEILWKNFKNNWKDYFLLIICGGLGLGIFFCGFGIQKIFVVNYTIRSLLSGYSTQILLGLYAPLGIVSAFMTIVLILYYVERSIGNYELLLTIGMSKKTYYCIRVIEMCIGCLAIGMAGIVFGQTLLRASVYVWGKWAAISLDIPNLGAGVYLKSFLIEGIVFIFSCMASRDIYSGTQLGKNINRQDIPERIPSRYLKILITAGSVLCFLQVILYSKTYFFESTLLLFLFLLGLFLIMRYGIALVYIKRRKTAKYLYTLLEHMRMWNKSLTNTGYLYILMVIQFSVIFLCCFQIVTVILSENAEDLFPYDIVCISDETDIEFFEEMQEKYKVKVESYPMVRISNYDSTEALESAEQKTVQGQHIGISESTYHILKKKVDKLYSVKELDLKEDGRNIYVVHQQDKSTKAQPIDFWLHSSMPLLHIGYPCTGVRRQIALTAHKRDIGYYFKEIEGEEFGSLIGIFGQGINENIVVFSDEYFEVAKEWWKTRNIYTGREIEKPEERIPNITIKQGPTRLVLVTGVRRVCMPDIEKMMSTYRKKHSYDESYNRMVQSCYLKNEAINKLTMERAIKLIINALMAFYFFLMSAFLIIIKLLTERKENKERNQFLQFMGMNHEDRKRLVLRENYRFFYIPAGIAAASTAILVFAVFKARMYSASMICNCLKHMLVFGGSYILIYAIVIWIMLFFYTRKL